MKSAFRLLVLAGFPLAALFSVVASAQTYPSKPIRIIVPFTPGSATDVMARIVGERLHAAWGQPVFVENKPGAGGSIGIRDTARADPDGYTLAVVSSGHAVNHVLYKDLGYDTLRDLSTVAMLGNLPSVLIVPPTLPVNSVKELVAMLKAKPGQYNYATAGVGSGAHVSTEKFNVAAGVKAVHVPLKGTPPILAETMAGRVEYAMVPAVSGMGPVRDGKVKPLAVTTSKRIAALPNVPTLGEAGFPEGESTFWLALLAPAKTPRDIVAKVNAEVARALSSQDVISRLEKLGTEPMLMSPAQADAFIRKEYEELGQVMRAAGLTPQ
jgi:tripartite-type tricarboxylate transporter receptor subunit TctC